MKKYYYLLLIIAFVSISCLTLSSCGGDEDENEDANPVELPKAPSVVGVWENGRYFVSLSEDNFLTAYIGDNFIDDGTYVVASDSKSFSCTNTYYNHTTVYDVVDITDTQMSLKITYMDAFGKSHNKNMIFTKSTKTPVSKDNGIVGKSCRFITASFSFVTYSFVTYNSATKSSEKKGMTNYPLSLHYIYFNENIYFQEFTSSSSQVPTIGGWTTSVNAGTVIACKLYFDRNGGISDLVNSSDQVL